jgi:MGT family glycosyltransferase
MTTAPLAYLAALVDGGGTVPPELAAVRQLVERGHDVTVLAEDSMEREVAATGATFRRWEIAPNRADRSPENDPYRDWEIKSPMKLFERLLDAQFMGPAARYVADVQQAVAEHRPDVVLCSQFAFGAMVAAEAAAIPFIVLMPNTYLLPAEGMPPLGMGLKPAKGPAGRLRDRVIGGFTLRVWDKKGLPRLNALRADLGLEPLAHFWDQVHQARRELVMTSADFDFPAKLPAPARYVGPVLDDPTWVEPWTAPSGGDPLVLVGLSSTFQDQGATIQRIIDALATLPVRAIVTAGPALDPTSVHAPANISVVASAPHREVLKHAAVVINHGGHGTVIKALAAGVPMVVMPHGRDQAENATRVTTRGAGIAVKKGAKPQKIAAAVRKILDDPSYRAHAERIGESVRRDAASGALLRELEAVATPQTARLQSSSKPA